MTLLHQAWCFSTSGARQAFEGVDGLTAILAPSIADRMRDVRDDAELHSLLDQARLAPDDEESWARWLEPTPEDLEESVAARMMLLLAKDCRLVGGLTAPPSFLAAHLQAIGWDAARIERCLGGARLETFFESHVPALSDLALDCRHWLAGGWLDAGAVAELRAELLQAGEELRATLARVARQLATDTGLPETLVGARLEEGHRQLAALFEQIATDDSALWIIQ